MVDEDERLTSDLRKLLSVVRVIMTLREIIDYLSSDPLGFAVTLVHSDYSQVVR